MKRLDVDEMRRTEVSILGYSLDESRRRVRRSPPGRPRCRQPALVRNGRAWIPAARPQQNATSATRGIRRRLAGQRVRGRGAQLPADERLAVALLSLIRQPTQHEVATRSDGDCKQVGRKALGAIGGDRPWRRAGKAAPHRHCPRLQDPAADGEAMPALPRQRRGFSQRTSSKRAKSVSLE
jgi:hypothetical protein